MFVLVLAADELLVNLNNAAEFAHVLFDQSGSNFVAHEPRCCKNRTPCNEQFVMALIPFLITKLREANCLKVGDVLETVADELCCRKGLIEFFPVIDRNGLFNFL